MAQGWGIKREWYERIKRQQGYGSNGWLDYWSEPQWYEKRKRVYKASLDLVPCDELVTRPLIIRVMGIPNNMHR